MSTTTERLRSLVTDPGEDRARLRFAAMLATVGVAHFVAPGPFRRIVPRWFPRPAEAVAVSGAAEVAAGALVALPATRRAGGWLALATIAAVYPANVQMAVDATRSRSVPAIVATWLRLPMQLPMLARAYRLTR